MLCSVFIDKRYKYSLVISLFFIIQKISGYGLPGVNLGFTNILDGGPVRPHPGVYWLQYTEYYHAHKFLNSEGMLLDGIPSPSLNVWVTVLEFVYQFEKELFFGGVPGFGLTLPIVLSSKIQPNGLGITDRGMGLGNLSVGIYSQWGAIMRNDNPFFIHRLEFDINFPAGKKNSVVNQIASGSNFFFYDLYWAATLYFAPRTGLSWRAYYLWNSKDKILRTKAGDAFFVNYSLEYELFPKFYMALVGYYLQQIHNDKTDGLEIPDSRERIFGMGPGIAYFFSPDDILFSNVCGEFGVRNRPQGVNFILRFVKHF